MDVAEFFEHHGVKGMRWGVRGGAAKSGSSSSSSQGKPKLKKAHELSDDELKHVINRMQMERTYNSLIKGHNKKVATTHFVKSIGMTAVKAALTAAATQAVSAAFKKAKILK